MPGEVVVIDGRPVLSEAEGTVRRPHDRAAVEQAVHLVSTWASPELVEGQHADLGTGQDAGSNRITAIPGLLEMLELGWRGTVPPGAIVLLSSDSATRIEKRPFHPSHRSRRPHCRQRWLLQHSLLCAPVAHIPGALDGAGNEFPRSSGDGPISHSPARLPRHCFPNIQTQKELKDERP